MFSPEERAAHCKSLLAQLDASQPLHFLLGSELLSFKVKRTYLSHHLKRAMEVDLEEEDETYLVVPRSSVMQGVCRRLGMAEPADGESVGIHANIHVKFEGEEGVDQGGVRRAWFELAAGHFVRSSFFEDVEAVSHSDELGISEAQRRLEGRRWSPAPVAVCRAAQPDWEAQFSLLGTVLGLALKHQEQVPIRFCPHFLREVLNRSPDCSHGSTSTASSGDASFHREPELRKVDPLLADKLKFIAEGKYEEIFGVSTLAEALCAAKLNACFTAPAAMRTRSVELAGIVELLPDGYCQLVTESNKADYLRRLVDHVLTPASTVQQAKIVREGMLRVLCPDMVSADDAYDSMPGSDARYKQLVALARNGNDDVEPHGLAIWDMLRRVLTLDELELILCGEAAVDVSAWEKCTKYEDGYSKDSPEVLWFWETVRSFSQAERAQLLCWTRGSSALPVGGFEELTFTLRADNGGAERLPAAHTCAFQLDLPRYESKEVLEAKLRRAILEDGFGLA